MLRSSIALGTMAAALLTGGPLTAQSNDTTAPTPPGRMIDLGGYRLHLHCTGSGSPTVILIHGFGDYSFDWALVQPEVAKVTRVCSYDRSGQAWSDPGPAPRGLDRLASELHALLAKAGESGPFVLVGHSWGGLIPRIYAAQHPQDVAGVVFVDASHEDMWMWLNGVTLQPAHTTLADWTALHERTARRGGGPPPSPDRAGGAGPRGQPVRSAPNFETGSAPALAPPYSVLPERARRWHAWARALPPTFTGGDWQDIPADLIAVAETRRGQTRPLGSKPVMVLSAGTSNFEDTREATAERQRLQHERNQRDLATLSSNGKQRVMTGSGHHIHLDQPDRAVSAIESVVSAVRTGKPL